MENVVWLFNAVNVVSEDAARAAYDLLQDILSGRTKGYAIIAMHASNKFTVDVAGECKRWTQITRGKIPDLDAALKDLER